MDACSETPRSSKPLSEVEMVSDVLERWPAAVAVFLSRGMACPGCAMAPFMTLGDAARAYGFSPLELTAELGAAVAGAVPGGPFPPPLPHRAAGHS
ncbi:DUF1858 domain-containing protein [Arenibaculum pallidiluteum]|uniref:DUF1858 domain-containing protein n=1 Tax=Arenibaculum pallidiluteum TaxID=2812559 RepID=UPI001A96D719|nr:DUF1858 domain-containing protein [Arenibaculum pallidiluteum]